MSANPMTKELKRLAKKGQTMASRLYLHVEADLSRESYADDAHFFLTCATDIYGSQDPKKEELAGLPGSIRNGSTSVVKMHTSISGRPFPVYDEAFRPTSGYWSLFACETFASIMALVPNDARVEFEVGLDAGTTEGLISVGFHSDHLYIIVFRTIRGKECRSKFLVDVSTGPHNSARFGVKF